ncbi:head-tail connector protein [Macrococcus equipercicus]|uniref:Head-tail connector protein n=1 Tax=Macrococcus equipercicus TaxID=69967 RepID=A0A9Q9BSC1_9STAP|nr:head-tail connector protein [Macrococcus equipercicus]UTH13299.1 head-tail connector protein [Macrococcus equipercicus]
MAETELLDDVKEFMKIDGDEENVTVKSLVMAAKPFIYSKTNYRFDYFKDLEGKPMENAQALLALKMLCLHWYENREPVGSGELIAMSLNSMIIHLQIEYGGFDYAAI